MLVVVVKKLSRYVLVIFLLACPFAAAQANPTDESRWAVKVVGHDRRPNKGPNCHALRYFSDGANLKNFDYNPQPLLGPDSKYDVDLDKVTSERVGEIEGFTIYDVIWRIGDDESAAPEDHFFITLKMILVERKPGEFCEIYHERGESEMLTVEASFVSDVGQGKILVTSERISGTGNGYEEHYWTFDKDGPIPLDLSVIAETLAKTLPAGMVVRKGGAFSIGTSTYDSGVWQEADPNCCPTAGDVHLKFALKNHKLVVVDQRFEPAKNDPGKSVTSGNFVCGVI
jgi:hypothetical protein